MASLKHCIGKLVEAGEVSQDVAAEAERLATEHTNDGYTRERAEAVALDDLLREAKSELSNVYKQLGIKPVIDNLPDDMDVWGDGKATVKAMREAVSREPYKQVLEKFITESGNVDMVDAVKAALKEGNAKAIMRMAQNIEAQRESFTSDMEDSNEAPGASNKAHVVPSEVDGIEEVQRDEHGNSLSMEPDPRQKFDSMDVTAATKPEHAAERLNMKQINFIFDNLQKGVPAFVAAVKKATPAQISKILRTLTELINGNELGDLAVRAEAALKALRGVVEGVQSQQGENNGRERSVQANEQTRSNAQTVKGSGYDSPISKRLRQLGVRLSEQIKSGQEVVERGQVGPFASHFTTAIKLGENKVFMAVLSPEGMAQLKEHISKLGSEFSQEEKANALAHFSSLNLYYDSKSGEFTVLGPRVGTPGQKINEAVGAHKDTGEVIKHVDLDSETGIATQRREAITALEGVTNPQLMNLLAEFGVRAKRLTGTDVITASWERLTGWNVGREGNIEFSNQSPVTKTTLPSDKEQADVITSVATLLGEAVTKGKVKLVKDLKDGMTLISGQVKFDADGMLELMQLALNAEDINGVADHEAMHQLFAWLHKNGSTETTALLERMAQNGILRKQLEELLQDHPEAVKQLADPEEFAAYLFQFWRAGRVKLGPQNEGFFNKAWKFVKGLLQQVRVISAENTDMQDVEGVFAGFASGQFSKDNRNDVIQALEKKYADSRRNNSKAFWQDGKIHDILRKGAYTAQGTLNDFNNPVLKRMGEMFNTAVGSKLERQGFLEAKAQKAAEKLNVLTNILSGVDQSDLAILRDALLKRERPKDAVAGRLFDKVQTHLKDMRQYLKDSGVKRFDFEAQKWVDMGTILDNYFPRVFDMQKIAADQDAFVKRLLEKHPNNLKLIADQANKEIATKEPAGKGTASYEFIKGHNSKAVTAEDVARSITARLINGMGDVELDESTSALGMTPLMRSINRRQLTWLDDAAFADYMSQDVVNTLVSYTMQSVKRAEYVKRFDNDGAKLRAMMDDAVDYEMQTNKLSQDQAVQKLAPAAQAVMALEGTLGYDINPNTRRLAGAVMTYQNWRLLITGLFGSMVDPLGIIVRGGEMQDAWNAFARGIREIGKGWKGEKSNDELSQLAEMLGTVDAGTFLDALGQTYSSLFMYGKLKSFNDTLFRINGLEAWNRAMRIQATGAAVGFIKKHLKNPEKDSQRWLQDELGLDPADKGLMIDGELDYSRDDVKQAIMRWVDTSIVRPNAAMRPMWASDPHYAVFYHLKSFAYAFHKTILERVINEAKHDNYIPALYLLSIYTPVMIAADAAKELLIIGDDDPAWMKSGLSGAIKHGAGRANIGVDVGLPFIDTGKSSPFLPIPGIPGLYAGGADSLDFFGPAVDQVKDFLLLPLNDKTLGGELVGALPGGNVLRKYTR